MKRKSKTVIRHSNRAKTSESSDAGYHDVLNDVIELLESARRESARAVNAFITGTYWEIGRRIVECEQDGEDRAEYGKRIVELLSNDLTKRFGRGFSSRNLWYMKDFFLSWRILQTPSAESHPVLNDSKTLVRTDQNSQTLPGKLDLSQLATQFPLPWSHYLRLLKVEKTAARRFYETEALRGGWSVRQLDRQISTLFYERTLASRNKGAMLKKGSIPQDGELLTPEEEIKDPLVLEFLGLKDEYSETDLENALIEQLETFLLELGGDFAFVGRQKRLRIDNEWYRIDLLFFHRALRCLVVIDLKVGKFTHADAGQMLLYLGYAAEHWTRPGENPPVGLVLCAEHNHAVAHYTLDRLSDKVLAAEYRLTLPDENTLAAELERTQAELEYRTPKNNRGAKKRMKGGGK
jgi:predicted nuclease of restriction endonuclease-like (RecB) superfamily